jgi:hypothetical protein
LAGIGAVIPIGYVGLKTNGIADHGDGATATTAEHLITKPWRLIAVRGNAAIFDQIGCKAANGADGECLDPQTIADRARPAIAERDIAHAVNVCQNLRRQDGV